MSKIIQQIIFIETSIGENLPKRYPSKEPKNIEIILVSLRNHDLLSTPILSNASISTTIGAVGQFESYQNLGGCGPSVS